MNEKQKQKQKTKKKKKGKTYLRLEIASTPYTLSQKPPHPLSWSFCRCGKYVVSRYFFLFLNNKKKKKKPTCLRGHGRSSGNKSANELVVAVGGSCIGQEQRAEILLKVCP